MNRHPVSIRRALLATGIAVGLGLSQTALADTAEDQLEITAGLAEALTLSCDAALSFGITRVGELDRTGATTITVDASDSSITVGGDDSNVTAGNGQAGGCTIAGSNADENDPVTVSIGGTVADLVSGVTVNLDGDASAFSGLEAPDTALSNLEVSNFTLNDSVSINASGGASFTIGGQLTIPETLIGDNLGGYANTVTVLVDDGFGD
ncbi:hypothetical protein [Thioalkalivibrio sp. AKL12]|uniref:hypothetical protein n=1 Tax=Thioalkalivibrio sp. AKL12 TaxID=1158159 RepID=UPI000377D49D|nr:hypothetical protein [Thioalkalivibrio sp. AKL12]